MKRKRCKIVVPTGYIKRISESIGCDRDTVSDALKFARDTDLAERIRREAIRNFRGKLVTIEEILTT